MSDIFDNELFENQTVAGVIVAADFLLRACVSYIHYPENGVTKEDVKQAILDLFIYAGGDVVVRTTATGDVVAVQALCRVRRAVDKLLLFDGQLDEDAVCEIQDASLVLQTTEAAALLGDEGRSGPPAKAEAPPSKKRRRQNRPVTSRQAKVVETVVDCEGDREEAAVRLGVSRQCINKTIDTAYRKMGQDPPPHVPHRKHRLPEDDRGQVNVVIKPPKDD